MHPHGTTWPQQNLADTHDAVCRCMNAETSERVTKRVLLLPVQQVTARTMRQML